MGNKNARVIIPFVLVTWLLAIAVFRAGTPPEAQAIFGVAFIVAVPVLVFYLMAEMGWSALAKRFRAAEPFKGSWQPCPTAQMAHVSVDHPDFQRNKFRLVGGTLRLGTASEGLYLSMLFSKVPLLGRFFPDVQIPWSTVSSARTFEAPGWFKPISEPGAILQAGYDPNYTGTFVELVVGQPPVFIQVSADVLGDAISRLPIAPDPST